MNLLQRMRGQRELNTLPLSVDEWAMQFNGNGYGGVSFSLAGSPVQEIENSFLGYVGQIHNREGTVAAAVAARSLLLSQLRFKFRTLSDGPQSQLFGSTALLPLEQFDAPLTRTRLLMRAEQHVSYSGNAYFHLPLGGRMKLLNPDLVSLIIASDVDPDTPALQLDGRLVGYLYTPDKNKRDAVILSPSEVVQWAPEPHPLNPWIGQSWVTSVLSEITGDRQITEHQAKFYDNAATPNLIFRFGTEVAQDTINAYRDKINAKYAGATNAGKNLFIGHGADVSVVGSQLQSLDLKDTQGGHESRIATRSRVPAVVLQIREGMQGSALSTGNYGAARRMWSDGWFSPTADGLCDALSPLIDVPGNSELTFDPARVMFLQEDRKDEADIGQAHAITIKSYVDAGYEPGSVVEAVRTGDLSKLKHSGLYSVQLQPAGMTQEAPQ